MNVGTSNVAYAKEKLDQVIDVIEAKPGRSKCKRKSLSTYLFVYCKDAEAVERKIKPGRISYAFWKIAFGVVCIDGSPLSRRYREFKYLSQNLFGERG